MRVCTAFSTAVTEFLLELYTIAYVPFGLRDVNIQIISWLNWFKLFIERIFIFLQLYTSLTIYAHHDLWEYMALFAFPFVYHLFFSVGEIYVTYTKVAWGDWETMRAMSDSKSVGYPLFLTWLPFPSTCFCKIYFYILRVLNGVTVVYGGEKKFGQQAYGLQTRKGEYWVHIILYRYITLYKPAEVGFDTISRGINLSKLAAVLKSNFINPFSETRRCGCSKIDTAWLM